MAEHLKVNEFEYGDDLGFPAMECQIGVISGDGIGPEIVTEAKKVLDQIGKKYMPKPLPDQAGSGLHINLSLYMEDRKSVV